MDLSTITSGLQSPGRNGTSEMSEEQRAKLQEILSNYDAHNLSSDDAKEIVAQVKDLGISLGRELGKEMRDAGFDPREVREAAGLDGSRRPPPPQAGVNPDNETLSAINEILNQYDFENLTEEDRNTMLNSLAEAGIEITGKTNLVDLLA